jgi:pimeloyl-ACP methyl ester carboxylesterase
MPAGPQAAGLPRVAFDPRDILRACTVFRMKDRAGLVGSAGAGPLVRDLLAADPAARFHLTGHSYGCRVLLAALSTARLPRQVDSLLLLEPAVNYLCFAGQVPKIGRPGGFRPALERVRQPVLSTFSARDTALHDFFHIAVRRRADLGEAKFAALGQVPSLYCALGGWGPGGLTEEEGRETMLAAYPERYDLGAGPVRIYGVRSDAGIRGHSDVVNDFTFWALYNQVTS